MNDTRIGFDLHSDNEDILSMPNIHSYECWSEDPHLFSIVSATEDLIKAEQTCPYCGKDTMEVQMMYLEGPDGSMFFGVSNDNGNN